MKFIKTNYIIKFCFLAILSTSIVSCIDDDLEEKCTETTWYQDSDSDGLGNLDVSMEACEQPDGYVADNSDADDTVAYCEPLTWYEDADGDGLGNPDVTTEACVQPEGYVADNSDTDDEPISYYVGIEYGADGTDYLSTGTSLTDGTISPVNNGFVQLGWTTYIQGVDQIFGNVANTITSYAKDENGNLAKGESVTTPLGMFAWEVVDESTLLLVGSPWFAEGTKALYLINTDSMSIVKTVETTVGDFLDTTTGAYGLSMPNGAKVIGDYLFISYYMFSGEINENEAKIAVYSYPELELQKTISDDRVSDIGRYFSRYGMLTDENKDLYTISSSSLANGFDTTSTLNSGILKIKNGETDFDDDFYMDFETLSGGYKLNDIYYAGNGKAVVRMLKDDSTAWSTYNPYSETPVLEFAIIDLYNETFTALSGDMELSGGGWDGVSLVEDGTVYVGVSNRNYSGIYAIDVETATVTEAADIDGNYAKALLSLK